MSGFIKCDVRRCMFGWSCPSIDIDQRVDVPASQQLIGGEVYTDHIKSRPEWEFAGVYTDKGISATDTRHRDGFNKMVQDALDGKIDLIVTKSVSRFEGIRWTASPRSRACGACNGLFRRQGGVHLPQRCRSQHGDLKQEAVGASGLSQMSPAAFFCAWKYSVLCMEICDGLRYDF